MEVWDYRSGSLLAELPAAYENAYTKVPVVNLDDDSLLAFTESGIYVYEYSSEAMIEQADGFLVGRKLTNRERMLNYCEIE
jgi:indole-3-glycerol phosphate synthase